MMKKILFTLITLLCCMTNAWAAGTGDGSQADDGTIEVAALELVGDDLVPVQPGAKSYSLMGTEVGDGYRGLVIRNGKKYVYIF